MSEKTDEVKVLEHTIRILAGLLKKHQSFHLGDEDYEEYAESALGVMTADILDAVEKMKS